MLKTAAVGGQSLVFKRCHEASVTKIRLHRFANPKGCKKIIGYDANALYLSTLLRDMPCGKEQVMPTQLPEAFIERLHAGSWFRFAEVDIEIPRHQWMKFKEMLPYFYTKQIPAEAMPPHMLEYLCKTGCSCSEQKKLVGALSSQKLLLKSSLLR